MKERSFYDIDGLNDEAIKFFVLSTALADESIDSFVGISIQAPGLLSLTNNL